MLYWLGDDSEGHQATWDFLDRRIEDVMQFEKSKADLKASPLAKLFKGPLDLLARVKHLPFPGGPIRMPLLAAAMLYYRIKDALN